MFPRAKVGLPSCIQAHGTTQFLEICGELFLSTRSLSKLEPVRFNDSGFKFAELS